MQLPYQHPALHESQTLSQPSVCQTLPKTVTPQRIQLWILQSNGCLCSYSCLDMDSQDVLLQSSKCRRELATFCPMFAEEMPSQLRDCLDVDPHGALTISSSALRQTCRQVALSMRENLVSPSECMEGWQSLCSFFT
ncbi:unnamed protein product [Leuciscus chuanchicus]